MVDMNCKSRESLRDPVRYMWDSACAKSLLNADLIPERVAFIELSQQM